MIVFGGAWQYGVQGRKADELLKYLKENMEFTHLEEGEDITAVKLTLQKKIDELNRKYPKTVKYYLRDTHEFLRISSDPGSTKGLSISVLRVKPIRKEASHNIGGAGV